MTQNSKKRYLNFNISSLLILTVIVALVFAIVDPLRDLLPTGFFVFLIGYCTVLAAVGVFRMRSAIRFWVITRRTMRNRREELVDFVDSREQENEGERSELEN